MRGLIVEGTFRDVDLLPGAHVIALGGYEVAIEARRQGFEVRDTLLVLSGTGTEFAFLLRKPCSEGTVAENVLRHGTGGLHVDACRVQGAGPSGLKPFVRGTTPPAYQMGCVKKGKPVTYSDNPGGRWPTNLVFVHGPECRKAGTRKIKAITGTLNGSWRKGHQYSGGWTGAEEADLGTPVGYGDADGMETVTAWECEAGCPVAELDRMSGYLRARGNVTRTVRSTAFFGGADPSKGGVNAGDSGGASRFFPQFESREALYVWFRRLLGIDPV